MLFIEESSENPLSFRTMKKLFCAYFCISTSCFAILPPAWEGVRELKAILDDKQLSQYLESGDVIEKIEHLESGWQIMTKSLYTSKLKNW